MVSTIFIPHSMGESLGEVPHLTLPGLRITLTQAGLLFLIWEMGGNEWFLGFLGNKMPQNMLK